MILNRVLTPEERKFSQYTLCSYWICFALAQACCGDTTLQLLALKLGVPENVVSAMGAMTYASFLVLPLGFMLGGKLGAGASMRLENNGIALSALLLALSPWLGMWVFWIGLVLFLACRSINNAMRMPLQKHIATELETPAMLARNYIGLYAFTLLGSLAVAWALKVVPEVEDFNWNLWNLSIRIQPAVWTLPAILALGGVLFVVTGRCIGRVHEPLAVKELASQPIGQQVKEAWRDPLMRHQIYVGCMVNVYLSAVVPMNILSAKSGLNVADNKIVVLAALQAVSSVVGSWIVKKVCAKFGPRKMMIFGYPTVWLLVSCWIFMPLDPSFIWLMVPFILGGLTIMMLGTPLEAYFLITVPSKLQLGGTFLIFVVTGGIAGVVGILMNLGIMKIAMNLADGDAMSPFRLYYIITGAIFALGILAPWSLPSKAAEYKAMIADNNK